MRVDLKVLVAGIGLLVSGLPVFAHHSGAAVFNSAKKFELKGVVTKVEWTNPHAHFFMDVKDSHDNRDKLESGTRQPQHSAPERLDAEFP